MGRRHREYLLAVAGFRRFPLILLAEAHCWPSTPEDATLLLVDSAGSRIIKFRTALLPNERVWMEQGWKILAIDAREEGA